MDRMCLWFLRRFVSPDAVTLLIRHFIVETNLLLAAVASRSRPWPGPGGARGSGRKAKMRLSQRNRRPNAVGNADSACNACYGCLAAIGLLGAVRRTPGAGGRLWSWHAGAVDGQAEVQR
jgi:hypothetical protein